MIPLLSHPAFSSAQAWLDDRAGAILVKEARQSVRSRFVVAVQFLFLTVLVVVLGAVLLGSNAGDMNRGLGRDVFVWLNVLLHVVCVMCVPLYVGVRLAAERDNTNVDLMFSTTLRPWSVILGKTCSGLLVGLLAVSACAPFMVLCYFLRGVDLATIAFTLGVDLVCLLVATLMAVFIGSLPVSMVVKIIVTLTYLSLACLSVRGFGYEMPQEFTQHGVVAKIWGNDGALIALAITAGIFIAGAGLLFVLSCALIAPATSNRSLPVRVYLTLLWLVSAVVIGLALLNPEVHGNGPEMFFAWGICWSMLWVLAMLVGASERDTYGPRLVKAIPQSFPKKWLAFLFYSGAAGGLLWAVLMAVATVAVAACAVLFSEKTNWSNERLPRGLYGMGLGLAMVLGYVLLAGCLRRALLGRFTRSVHTGVIAVGLMVLGMLLPVLLSFLMYGGRHFDIESSYFAHLFNPLSVFIYAMDYNSGHYATVAAICSVTAGFMCLSGFVWSLPWLWRQGQVFGVAGELRP